MFPIRKVDQLQAEDIEYLGTKRKFWFTSDGQRYLFKAEERGTGEDWAEKVVCELARCLGIPHVEYELAHEYDRQKPCSRSTFSAASAKVTLRRQESGWANWVR